MPRPKESGQNDHITGFGFALRILNDPKLLALTLVILSAAAYVYWRWFIYKPPPVIATTCKQWTLSGRLMSEAGNYLNLKGVKVGIESGPFSDDDQITNGIFKIAKVDLPADKFIQLYLEYNSTMHIFLRRPLDKIEFQADSGTCTITFQENLMVPDDVLKGIVTTKPTPPPSNIARTFSINVPDPSIRRQIEKIAHLKYDPASTHNEIVITYDPTKVIFDDGTYTFKPSPPMVLINGRKIILQDTLIPEPRSGSHKIENMKSYGDAESIAVVTAYIKHHPGIIDQWVRYLQ